MTLPEVLVWRGLRRRTLGGAKFRRQHPLGPYVLDFYCAEHRLAIEVDGWGHNMGSLERDEQRNAYLAKEGVQTLRFAAQTVLNELESVLDTVEAALTPSPASPVLPHDVGEMRQAVLNSHRTSLE